jgi:hypothetical protein
VVCVQCGSKGCQHMRTHGGAQSLQEPTGVCRLATRDPCCAASRQAGCSLELAGVQGSSSWAAVELYRLSRVLCTTFGALLLLPPGAVSVLSIAKH